jgi:hypothetical protein
LESATNQLTQLSKEIEGFRGVTTDQASQLSEKFKEVSFQVTANQSVFGFYKVSNCSSIQKGQERVEEYENCSFGVVCKIDFRFRFVTSTNPSFTGYGAGSKNICKGAAVAVGNICYCVYGILWSMFTG